MFDVVFDAVVAVAVVVVVGNVIDGATSFPALSPFPPSPPTSIITVGAVVLCGWVVKPLWANN